MKNKNTSSEDRKDLPDQRKDEMNLLFKEASQIESRHSITVSDRETESAFHSVAQKAGIQSKSYSIFKTSPLRFAAAAVFLLCTLGTAYLFTPHQISVADGTTHTIELADQTTITLNSGSTLTYPRWFGWFERSVTLNGEAFFEVTTTGDPFRVITQNAKITVLGTRFNVSSWLNDAGNRTTVFLREGKVSFAPRYKQKQAIILEPGQLSWISKQHTKPAAPQEVDQSKATAWLQQGLAFENQPLSAIFAEISRRFDVEVKTKSDQILHEKLTIYISNPEGIEQTLRDICTAKGLHFIRKGDTFIITRSS